MATVEDFENFISEKWCEYCAAERTRVKPPEIRIPFQDWEADYSIKGIQRGFFEVVLCDCVTAGQSHLHYDALGAETKKNFFDKRGVGACREAVTQFAALTELIVKYAYPPDNVMAESIKRDGSNRYGFDGLVFDINRNELGSVRIALEAKCESRGLATLVRQIKTCLEHGEHGMDVHRKSEEDSHKKYQALRAWRPAYLWLVCPTERAAYAVRHDGEWGFSLHPVDDIPKFTVSNL